MASNASLARDLPGFAGSNNNDVELFLRLLRVVRRLDAQDGSLLGSQDAPSSQPSRREETGSRPRRRPLGAKRQRRTARQVVRSEDELDDDESDEPDEESEGDDGEDEEDEEYEEDQDRYDEREEHEDEDQRARDLTIHVATSSSERSAKTNNTVLSKASKRKRAGSQQKKTKTPPPRSQQQRQQHEQQELPQQRKKSPERQQQQRHHALVEKRYRSVINSKIQQLSDLIPASNTFNMATDSGPDPQTRQDQEANVAGLGSQKASTKSAVLDRALQYLNHLVATHQQFENEREALRRKVQGFVDDVHPQDTSSGTVAQVAV